LPHPDPTHTPTQDITLIGDSGATDLFVTQSDAEKILEDMHPCTAMNVELPNGQVITSIAEGTLELGTGPTVSVPGYVFANEDLTHSLLGLAAITNDADCTITLDKHEMVIRKDGIVVSRTLKAEDDKLWHMVCRKKSNKAQANASVRLESDGEYVAFAHEAFGSPAASTFIQAAQRGWLGNYPRLSVKMISTHRPHTEPTAKGHLDQTRQGLGSTKANAHVPVPPKTRMPAPPRVRVPLPPVITVEQDTDMDGSAEVEDDENERPEHVYTRVINLGHENHSDGTGRMTPSLAGNKYVLVSVYDGYIKMQAYKDRSQEEYVETYSRLLKFLARNKKTISVQRLDNETSTAVEELFDEHNVEFQYVPPHCHRALRAERAIRSAKNHFIATLCTADEDFPMHMWG